MIELARDGWVVRVSTLGAALNTLEYEGISLLAHPPVTDPRSGYHGAVLAPWPGRVPYGRYEFGGQQQQLVINEPAYGHALHGFADSTNWTIDAVAPDSVTLTLTLEERPGYPFSVGLSVTYALVDGELRCTTRWENLSADPAPFGIGFHPYLSLGGRVDDLSLHVVAGVSVDSEMQTKAPLPERDVDGRDFVHARRIGEDTFARCYGELERTDGWACATVADGRGRSIRLFADPAFPWFQTYTGDLPSADLWRTGLALEPQTCPPGAFVTGRDLLVLEPGECGSGVWRLAVEGIGRAGGDSA